MKRKSMLAIAIASAVVVLGGTAISAQDDGAFAQSTVVKVENEPAPSLTVQPPLPGPLAQGVVFIPYRLENLRIVPVGGAAARDISPRVGHLHITLDDLPWQWADYGGSSTVILVGLPRGEHKLRIEAVDAEGRPFIARTVTLPCPARRPPPAEQSVRTARQSNLKGIMERKSILRTATATAVLGAPGAAAYAQDKFDKYSLKSPSGMHSPTSGATRTGRWTPPPAQMKCSRSSSPTRRRSRPTRLAV